MVDSPIIKGPLSKKRVFLSWLPLTFHPARFACVTTFFFSFFRIIFGTSMLMQNSDFISLNQSDLLPLRKIEYSAFKRRRLSSFAAASFGELASQIGTTHNAHSQSPALYFLVMFFQPIGVSDFKKLYSL